MSIHPSLRVNSSDEQQRSVLSRIERIKDLMKKGLWKEDQEVTGLPKTKMIRLKTKKTKTAADASPEAVAGAAGVKPEAAKKPGETTAKDKK